MTQNFEIFEVHPFRQRNISRLGKRTAWFRAQQRLSMWTELIIKSVENLCELRIKFLSLWHTITSSAVSAAKHAPTQSICITKSRKRCKNMHRQSEYALPEV